MILRSVCIVETFLICFHIRDTDAYPMSCEEVKHDR